MKRGKKQQIIKKEKELYSKEEHEWRAFVIISKNILSSNERRAFIFKIVGSRGCKIRIALEQNEIMIRWSKAKGLLEKKLIFEDFVQIIKKVYFKKDKRNTRSIKTAQEMWCFLREIEVGSYVVVPTKQRFYIARIDSEPFFDEKYVTVNAAYRRRVEWLGYKIPIPYTRASKALREKIAISKNCYEISELITDVVYSMRAI
ncbi:MAG: hypothetical protein KGD59_01280 [Candidatus Heimdallarchaeota archaeon]|nr:hypothetical protein [Candidatus Heimdallarchaeota archaeon]MBY8993152.1 hypothetical protein [Candidatus Heimdallarchaeota archaeon]